MTKPGNKNAEKHGLERGVKALQHDNPFTGVLCDYERAVETELHNDGILALRRRRAIRKQALADAFGDLVEYQMQRGAVDEVDRFTKRYGWLDNAADRSWSDLQKHEDSRNDAIDPETLKQYRGDDHHNDLGGGENALSLFT